MQKLVVLKLYYPQSSRLKPRRLWHHLFCPSLSQHLLRSARRHGIHQVILHASTAGYLPGQRTQYQHTDTGAPHHCLELLDEEHRLRTFLADHADELKGAKVILLTAEIAL